MDNIVELVISAVAGGIITLLTTWILERRKEKREDRKEEKKKQEEIAQNRPEMAIVDFKDYIERPGYGIKQKCDIEVFVAHISNVTVTDEGKSGVVYANYDEEDFDSKKWSCVIYTFENKGKTDISMLDIICTYKRDTCIFPCGFAREMAKENVLNYRLCHDKKVRVGERITVKFCYHSERICTGIFTANMVIGMEDDRGGRWLQPLFAPLEKVYDSYKVSYKEYRDEVLVDKAEECFKKPWLW